MLSNLSSLHIQFTSSTQIKQITNGFWMHYKYSLPTYLFTYLLTNAVELLNDHVRLLQWTVW